MLKEKLSEEEVRARNICVLLKDLLRQAEAVETGSRSVIPKDIDTAFTLISQYELVSPKLRKQFDFPDVSSIVNAYVIMTRRLPNVY